MLYSNVQALLSDIDRLLKKTHKTGFNCCFFFSISTVRASDIEYSLMTGTAAVDSSTCYAIVIVSLKLPASVTVKASTCVFS